MDTNLSDIRNTQLLLHSGLFRNPATLDADTSTVACMHASTTELGKFYRTPAWLKAFTPFNPAIPGTRISRCVAQLCWLAQLFHVR